MKVNASTRNVNSRLSKNKCELAVDVVMPPMPASTSITAKHAAIK